MMCLLITALIFFSFYVMLSRVCAEELFHKATISFLLTCSQIVLTELFLGVLNLLYLPYLVAMNVAISAIIVVLASKGLLLEPIIMAREDAIKLKQNIIEMSDRYSFVLMVLLGLTYSWILVASYYLPPRGVDDLVYHLPPVFEYIKSHRISLLPVDIRPFFAFPENAELIFMWPTIFSHNQRMIDSVNIPFALFSVTIVYALARQLDISRNNSFFAAMLYAMCPVVIMQSGSNYVDMMVSLFFLAGLYYAVLYFNSQRTLFLYATGLAVGMACGIKYTAFFLAIPIHLIVAWRTRKRRLHLAGYFSVVLLLGSWWYLRNAVVLNSPLYPMDIRGMLTAIVTGGGNGEFLRNIHANLNKWFLHYPLEDVGIGSYDGGFGLVFWGIGFPAWIYISYYTAVNYRHGGLAKPIMLALMPVGFLMLLSAPVRDIYLISRYSIFIVAAGLLALASMLEMLKDRICESVIKTVCIVSSAITICLMSVSESPSFRLGDVIADRINDRHPSEYKYIMNSEKWYSELRYIWEPLDYLTRDDKHGLDFYLAADRPYFIMAPLYGSNLQNNNAVLNSSTENTADALVYAYANKDIFGRYTEPNIYYYKSKIDMEEMLANDDYLTVTIAANGCLLLKKSIINDPVKLRLLKSYYEETWPGTIQVARQIMPDIKEPLSIVTSNKLAYGVRYLDMSNNNLFRVILTPERMEEKVVRRKGIKRCYTFEKPLKGFKSKIVASVSCDNKIIDTYLNYME